MCHPNSLCPCDYSVHSFMPHLALLRVSDLTTLEPAFFGHFIEVSPASPLKENVLQVHSMCRGLGSPASKGHGIESQVFPSNVSLYFSTERLAYHLHQQNKDSWVQMWNKEIFPIPSHCYKHKRLMSFPACFWEIVHRFLCLYLCGFWNPLIDYDRIPGRKTL